MEAPEITGENRDETGRFAPGMSGNSNGRPKGSISITSAIKKKLDEINPKNQKRYLDEVVNILMEKAIEERDFKAIREIWGHVDSRPRQTEETEDEKPIPILINLIRDASEVAQINGR